jgi:hypothetical protein
MLIRNARDLSVMNPIPGSLLLQEHAAWNKGREALLRGAAMSGADFKDISTALEQGHYAKRPALGSYWGGSLGKLLGLLGGGALGHQVKPGAGTALGGLMGHWMGGPTGAELGLNIGKWMRPNIQKKLTKDEKKFDKAKAKHETPKIASFLN